MATAEELLQQTQDLRDETQAFSEAADIANTQAQSAKVGAKAAESNAVNAASAAAQSVIDATYQKTLATDARDLAVVARNESISARNVVLTKASEANTDALTALSAKTTAEAASTKADNFANYPRDQIVPGETGYSGRHWYEAVEELVAGSTGDIIFLGSWDAAVSGTPPTPAQAVRYLVISDGIVDGKAVVEGDYITYDVANTNWIVTQNTGRVSSVNGKVGPVVLDYGDFAGSQNATFDRGLGIRIRDGVGTPRTYLTFDTDNIFKVGHTTHNTRIHSASLPRWDNGTTVRDLLHTGGGQSVDGTFSATGNITAPNLKISEWDTAYSWGDHASAGYAADDHNHDIAYAALNHSHPYLPTAGGTVNGDLTVTGETTLTGTITAGNFIVLGNNSPLQAWNQAGDTLHQLIRLSTGDDVIVGSTSGGVQIKSSGNPTYHDGTTEYTLYHTGNKPTAADVGAATSGHNHDGVYAPNTHNHDGTYAPVSHTHSGFASDTHNHDNTYLLLTGGTATGNISAPAMIATSGSIESKALAAANAHLWLKDENGKNEGLLYWSRGDDVVRLRRYATNGSSVEGELILSADKATYNGYDVVTTAARTLTNTWQFQCTSGFEATTSSVSAPLQVYQPTAGTDAVMTFHVNGDYAQHFGLDGSTNRCFFTGWSGGASKRYAITADIDAGSYAKLSYTDGGEVGWLRVGSGTGIMPHADNNSYVGANTWRFTAGYFYDIYLTNDWQITSDRTVKDNLTPLTPEEAASKLGILGAAQRYDRLDTGNKGELGTIAQWCVAAGMGDITSQDENGKYSVSYRGLQMYQLSARLHDVARIEELERRVAELEKV